MATGAIRFPIRGLPSLFSFKQQGEPHCSLPFLPVALETVNMQDGQGADPQAEKKKEML